MLLNKCDEEHVRNHVSEPLVCSQAYTNCKGEIMITIYTVKKGS